MRVRLKAVARQRVAKGLCGERPIVNLEDVESGTGRLSRQLMAGSGLDMLGFEPGDVLFSKLRPYLAKSVVVQSPMFGSSEFISMVPSSDLDSRFLGYTTLSTSWVQWAAATSYGTKMPRTNWEAVGEYRLELPRLDEQRRIADFLDDQTGLLDHAQRLRQRQAEALGQAFWSWFLEQVHAEEAPVLPLRRALNFVADGPFGSAFSSSDYVSDGPAVVRLGNIGFAEYRGSDQARVPDVIWSRFSRCQVRPGDLLIASLGDVNNHAGRACVAPDDLGTAMVKGKSLCARVRPERADARFLALLMSSPLGADLFNLETRGSTRSMINIEILKSVRLPLPTVERQAELATRAIALRQVFERQGELVRQGLALLQERREALITAAVTGQCDVTTTRSVA